MVRLIVVLWKLSFLIKAISFTDTTIYTYNHA